MAVQEHSHNYEISSVLITIILLGKLLETISKSKTIDKLSQLASQKSTTANLITSSKKDLINLNSSAKEIPVELLQVNDLIKVTPGSIIPIDGEVIFGKGLANESLLTGESSLVPKDSYD